MYPLWVENDWKFLETAHLTSIIRVYFLSVNSSYFSQIPLGCLPKNESLNEDMVDILEHLHSNYVPMSQVNGVKTPADFVCFGGDQLTEERSRNIQNAQADGRSVDEKLDGVWCKNEDWHAMRISYQVCYMHTGILHIYTHFIST